MTNYVKSLENLLDRINKVTIGLAPGERLAQVKADAETKAALHGYGR